MDESGHITGRFPATEPFNLWKLVHLWDYVLQQSVYFRKSVLDEVGYLEEDLNWALDWDLLIRIGCRRYDLAYIPEEMGALREYDAAKSFSGGHRALPRAGRDFSPPWSLPLPARVLRLRPRHLRRDSRPLRRALAAAAIIQGAAPPGAADRSSPDRETAQGGAGRLRRRLDAGAGRVDVTDGRIARSGFAETFRSWRVSTVNRLPSVSMDRRVDTQSIGFGDFEIECELPEPGQGAHPLIVIEATRSIPRRRLVCCRSSVRFAGC